VKMAVIKAPLYQDVASCQQLDEKTRSQKEAAAAAARLVLPCAVSCWERTLGLTLWEIVNRESCSTSDNVIEGVLFVEQTWICHEHRASWFGGAKATFAAAAAAAEQAAARRRRRSKQQHGGGGGTSCSSSSA
jgi:Zn-dependent M28 family amino/carboxypeptidase